jgi:hypothetical protein
MKTLEELYSQKYTCPGPSRLTEMVGGLHAEPGTLVCYDDCLVYPDCGCARYDLQCRRIEEAEEG